MNVINQTKNNTIASNATIAETPWSRMVGLLNRRSLSRGEALVISPCNSIHMFFMRFSIDVIFVNKNSEVEGLVKNIQPFCLSPIFWGAKVAIELPAGTIDLEGVALGDKIIIK